MPKYTGFLKKMCIENTKPATYVLKLDKQHITINDLLDHTLTITYTGSIYCIQCGRKTSKSFQQGHCFPCFKRLQECGCLLKPEQCRIYEGICQKDDWAHAQCFGDHIIYLANTSGPKVGITRANHIPSRWLDQGATQALAIMKVANRYQSGLIEVCLKNHISDKTNWRALLKENPKPVDLIELRQALFLQAHDALTTIENNYPGEIKRLDEKVVELDYPVLSYLEKISAFNLDKSPTISGKLQGMKGQYLIFDEGVVNIRKFSGYEIMLQT